MLKFNMVRTENGEIGYIETPLCGYELLNTAKLNKGCAFSREEREIFHLIGKIPYHSETLEEQVERLYAQYQAQRSNLGKHIHLNALHDYNETLFYKLTSTHLEEMLPILYTPTVSEAVERFSLEHRKPRGLYLSYPDRDRIAEILRDRLTPDIDLIVATDGERVLGLGDQGIGGMSISIAKLMIYTLCAGINPNRVLPIQLDVGTNNQQLLNDPKYLGWRAERINGQAYDDFIDNFVQTIKKSLPHVFLHWEDFGRNNARKILERYRYELCSFNDDMQGTGAITLASVLSACQASGVPLAAQRFVIFGAGTAGIGVADQIYQTMIRYGVPANEARKQFYVLDKQGLLTNQSTELLDFQKPYAQNTADIQAWKLCDANQISLYDVIINAKPTTLIGCSAVSQAFSEEIIRNMASFQERPCIMPLSNPTHKAEARPEDILQWTEGKAIIATGSPFPNVDYQGRSIRIAQSNNAFVFPGIGLGAIAVKAKAVSDKMLWAATQTVCAESPMATDKDAPLLPKLADAKTISRKVAIAVAEQARSEGLSQIPQDTDIERAITLTQWEAKYYPYRRISGTL